MYSRFPFCFLTHFVHHFWLAKLFLSKCLHENNSGDISDERNTSKIETRSYRSPGFGTMIRIALLRGGVNAVMSRIPTTYELLRSKSIKRLIGIPKGVYIGETLPLRVQREGHNTRSVSVRRTRETARYNGNTTTAKR